MTETTTTNAGITATANPGDGVAAAVNALLVRAAVTNRVADHAVAAAKSAKSEVVTTVRRGGTLIAANPLDLGQEIAQVTVSKVTWAATTTDRLAVDQWVKARYPERVERKTQVLSTATPDDVLNILRIFAPYLVEEVEVVPDHVVRELELKSEEARQPMGWGGEIDADAPQGIKVSERAPSVRITYRDIDLLDDLTGTVLDMDGNVIGGGL